jgi:hypothetical protein
VTLSDALTVSGTFITQTNTVTFNTSTINIQGSFTLGSNVIGTSTMNINGTGNQTWNVSGGLLNLDTDINKPSGNLIFAAGSRNFGSTTTGKTLTYTTLGTGTLVTTGSNLILYNCSVRSNGVNWGPITGSSNILTTTITLLDNMACDTLASGGSFGTNFNGSNLNINGNINISSAGIFGTAIFNIVGTVNQTWAGGILGANLKINKPSGSFIMTATCSYGSAINPLFEHVNGPVITTGSTFSITGNCQVKSNVSNPNAIIFNNLGFGNQPYIVTLIDNMTINSFLPNGGGSGGGLINGNTLFVKGDITLNAMGTAFFFGGTAIFNISGTGNQIWNNLSTSTLRNSVVIDKPSGTLSITGVSYVAWGFAGNTLTYIQGTINPGTSTFISATGSIFNLTNPGFLLFNWNPSTGTQTINNNPLIINGSTLIQGSITFAGNRGFTTNNLTCTLAATIITLQNIVASPSAEYIVNGVLNLTGTLANRIRLEAAGRANFVGSIGTAVNPTLSLISVTSVTTGTIATGMTVSQASGQIPAGLSPFINDRPIIDSPSGPNWFINKSLGTRVPPVSGTTTLAAGYKAKFTLANNPTSSQNVIYVQTQDIDSSYGKTIQVTGSNGDDAPTEQAILRTLNWVPLVATSGSVYYTFIN